MYYADNNRYKEAEYKRCGKSGLMLPKVSLGLWHNFGTNAKMDNMKKLCFTAFDKGITHFDLANNYGPIYGAAEENFGRILNTEMKPYRDEMIISTKAGYDMWEGPYGNFGSKKYLVASLDQSLKRMGLDYVDIFYHHRPDYDTPLWETMHALDSIVKSGKALYVGLSNYNGERMKEAAKILEDMNCPFIINQNRYSIMDRTIENNGLLDAAKEKGKGVICFCPLEQGLLTDRYIDGIPIDSRVKTDGRFLNESRITPEVIEKVKQLNCLAKERGQSLAQMALGWILKDETVTSVLIGASKSEQIIENIEAVRNTSFTDEELKMIDEIVK
ncbi:MAG: aldo/keto reductase [Clostridia bacterium]